MRSSIRVLKFLIVFLKASMYTSLTISLIQNGKHVAGCAAAALHEDTQSTSQSKKKKIRGEGPKQRPSIVVIDSGPDADACSCAWSSTCFHGRDRRTSALCAWHLPNNKTKNNGM